MLGFLLGYLVSFNGDERRPGSRKVLNPQAFGRSLNLHCRSELVLVGLSTALLECRREPISPPERANEALPKLFDIDCKVSEVPLSQERPTFFQELMKCDQCIVRMLYNS